MSSKKIKKKAKKNNRKTGSGRKHLREVPAPDDLHLPEQLKGVIENVQNRLKEIGFQIGEINETKERLLREKSELRGALNAYRDIQRITTADAPAPVPVPAPELEDEEEDAASEATEDDPSEVVEDSEAAPDDIKKT